MHAVTSQTVTRLSAAVLTPGSLRFRAIRRSLRMRAPAPRRYATSGKLRSVAIAAADQRPLADYSSVWSSTSASGALFLTDSIPAGADCLRSYASLVAMTCPLDASRLKWYLPVEPFLRTNLPAISNPQSTEPDL